MKTLKIEKCLIPEIAKWKAVITQSGVDLFDPYCFNNFPEIDSYKIKYRRLEPRAVNFKVYDFSKDLCLIPAELIIKVGNKRSIVKLRFRKESSLCVYLEDGKILIKNRKNGSFLPIETELVKKMSYQDKKLPKSIDKNESKLSNYVDIVGLDRLSVIPFDGCWNWNCGKACKFCDFSPKREDLMGNKATLNKLIDFNGNIEKWWNVNEKAYFSALKYSFQQLLSREEIGPHRHLVIMSGNLSDSIQTWKIAKRTIEVLNSVESVSNFDCYLNICPHPNVELLEEIKLLGIKQVQYNLEVYGKKLFSEVCPGKCDYDTFVQKLEEAVGVMGRGNVRSNFVLGLQPANELLRGIKKLALKGIVADYSIFQPKRCTPFENRKAPSIRTILNFTDQLVKVYEKNKFKGIYCRLSSRSSLINEFL